MQIILIFALCEDGFLWDRQRNMGHHGLRCTLRLGEYNPASVSNAQEVNKYKRYTIFETFFEYNTMQLNSIHAVEVMQPIP